MSKQALARELIALGCPKSFNTLRKYSMDKLLALKHEVEADAAMVRIANEDALQSALKEPQEPELPGSEIDAAELVPVHSQTTEQTLIGTDTPYTVPTDRELYANAQSFQDAEIGTLTVKGDTLASLPATFAVVGIVAVCVCLAMMLSWL